MSKWIAEFELEDGDTMPEHMDLEYKGAKIDFHCRPMWIPVSERLPECEQEVLICTKKKVYVSKKTGMEWYEESVITPALYEDGTMLEVDSKWIWEDIDYAGWDEEEDCGIIPEGWWENRHFNPDEVYNNPVDREVIAWMPLPEPYQKGGEQS